MGIAFLALTLSSCGTSLKSPTQPSVQPIPALRAKPDILSSSEVKLDDQESVIGISVKDRYRAYVVRALTVSQSATSPSHPQDRAKQIVNDSIGDVSITVTYCAKTKTCRVFTSSSTDLLHVQVAPEDNGGGENLVLLVGGVEFQQSDPAIPLLDHPFQLTTWGEWTKEHPTTDVFLGALYDE